MSLTDAFESPCLQNAVCNIPFLVGFGRDAVKNARVRLLLSIWLLIASAPAGAAFANLVVHSLLDANGNPINSAPRLRCWFQSFNKFVGELTRMLTG